MGWAARLLGQLDQAPLMSRIDFNQVKGNSTASGHNANPDGAMRQRLAAFRCPSDTESGAGKRFDLPDGSGVVRGNAPNANYGHTNYLGNLGNGGRFQPQTSSGNINRFNGIFTEVSSVQIRDITDGTTNTLAVAECVIGFPRLNEQPIFGGNAPYQTTECPLNGTPDTSSSRQIGNSWFYHENPGSSVFTTSVGPNSKFYDCGNNTDDASIAARSMHTGGVQVTLCDGSVRFASENIDLGIWQRLGARNDGDTIGEW